MLNYMYCARSCVQDNQQAIRIRIRIRIHHLTLMLRLLITMIFLITVIYFGIMTQLLPVWSAQAVIYLHVFGPQTPSESNDTFLNHTM